MNENICPICGINLERYPSQYGRDRNKLALKGLFGKANLGEDDYCDACGASGQQRIENQI